jgi:proteasome alpha subunit
LGYDRAITVFSPDGRLFQVEYAREAVKRGTTTVGVKYWGGITLVVDKRVTSRLVEPRSVEKIYQIDDHIGCATSGLVADARVLVDRARLEAQINRLTYNEPIQTRTLAKRICDFKQQYTQYGGVRPFGTALLIGGMDGEKSQLFETDPSGALMAYKATAIGSGKDGAIDVLEEGYRDDMDRDEAILLAIRALQAGREEELGANSVEVATMEEKGFERFDTERTNFYVERLKGSR